MAKFLEKLAGELVKNKDYHLKTIVLPNKRSGVFLKKALIDLEQKPVIAPRIISISDFLSYLSPYQPVEELPLLLYFYRVYQKIYTKEAQNFDDFIKWAPSILQDFNEIDTFLVNAKEVFTYINEVKKIEDWQLQPENPKLISDYLKFYASLYDLYQSLQQDLHEKNLAYQGMIYRYVAEHIQTLSSRFKSQEIIFAGFNALSRSEEEIIRYLLLENKASIYWDADEFYLKKGHEAGKFIRKHLKNFKNFKWVENHFNSPKHIEIIEVTGHSTQSQAVARILEENNSDLLETAVVLNDENLLLPLINSLPAHIDAVNISLGLPLEQVPVSRLFEQIIQMHLDYEQYGRFNIDTIIALINQTYLEQILPDKEIEQNQILLQKLSRYKTKLISQKIWQKHLQENESFLQKFFVNKLQVKELLDLFAGLTDYLSNQKLNEIDQLALLRFEKIFLYLKNFVRESGEIKSMRSLYMLYKRLMRHERLSFEGEPLQGLQIMGILETRLLDFKNVILTSMNEGIIPKGKNERSIIPFELKKHFGLPMHYEHNAVIAYHFYRLLQRAEKITLLYNSSPDGLGISEQSRFITQLENELNPEIHRIEKKQLDLQTNVLNQEPEIIHKDTWILERLKDLAQSGFSPTSLATYIRNPVIFYKKKVLQLNEESALSDSIPANTMGSIIHEVLEKLYKKHEGKALKNDDFKEMLEQYEDLCLKTFIKHTFSEDTPVDPSLIEGKNLIVFEIIKKNIKDIIRQDQKLVLQNNRLEIVELEKRLKAQLPVAEHDIYIKGVVDRIDRLNGQLRIIDYKTGKVDVKNLKIPNPEEISEDPKKEKLFQLLTYAWLYYKSGRLLTTDLPLQTGIISTRQIKQGFLPAQVNQEKLIDTTVIKDFEKQLIDLTAKILHPEIPFVETDSPY